MFLPHCKHHVLILLTAISWTSKSKLPPKYFLQVQLKFYFKNFFLFKPHAYCFHSNREGGKSSCFFFFKDKQKRFHIVNVIAVLGTIHTADATKRGKACGSAGKQIFFYSNSVYTFSLFLSFLFLLCAVF